MTDKKIDLAAEGLLGQTAEDTKVHQAALSQGPDEEDLVEYINKVLLGLQDSMGSMHIGIRILGERVSQVERYVAYLLEQDPKIGDKIKAMAKASTNQNAAAVADAVAKAQAEAPAKG